MHLSDAPCAAMSMRHDASDEIGEFYTMTLGRYLFERLKSIGSSSVFGVPGDFNLSLLETNYMGDGDKCDTCIVDWIGCCNELNAAYAADGYSRYSNKIGVVMTTYGVGELSAINAVAGASAENVKMLHVVGVPPAFITEDPLHNSTNVHHLVPDVENANLKGPNYRIYHDMVQKIACSVAYIDSIETACDQIDNVITEVSQNCKPGYLFIPADLAKMNVTTRNLSVRTNSDSFIETSMAISDEERVALMSKKILEMIYEAKFPAVIVDQWADRLGCNKILNQLVKDLNIWTFATVQGKSIIDESTENFMGIYNGKFSSSQVTEKIMLCDFILFIGPEINEMNTGGYSFKFNEMAKIFEVHPKYFKITASSKLLENSGLVNSEFRSIITQVGIDFDNDSFHPLYDEILSDETICDTSNYHSNSITQTILQTQLEKQLNEGDVLVCDSGSFQFAIPNLTFPSNLKYISQGSYLSIGMALPAALGIGIAMKEDSKVHIYDPSSISHDYKPRLILLEGDGAAQMTIQELSSLIRHKIPIEILLLNNNGYTIERAIEGRVREYNDIMPWSWTQMTRVFGDPQLEFTNSKTLTTRSELIEHFQYLKTCPERNKINFLEIVLDTFDIPPMLQDLVDELCVRKKK